MTTELEELIKQIHTDPENVEFQDVIAVIENNYSYTPTSFSNGPGDYCINNAAGENEGSCKIFSFARLHQLDSAQTLNCFGRYYRDDVLNNPEGTDHANIRTFIKYGWPHIAFDKEALKSK